MYEPICLSPNKESTEEGPVSSACSRRTPTSPQRISSDPSSVSLTRPVRIEVFYHGLQCGEKFLRMRFPTRCISKYYLNVTSRDSAIDGQSMKRTTCTIEQAPP